MKTTLRRYVEVKDLIVYTYLPVRGLVYIKNPDPELKLSALAFRKYSLIPMSPQQPPTFYFMNSPWYLTPPGHDATIGAGVACMRMLETAYSKQVTEEIPDDER